MNKKIRIVALLLCLMLMFTLLLSAYIGCIYRGSPIVDLIIENQTDQVITIVLDGGLVGKVRASDMITKQIDIGMSEYVIEAKNTQGKIVFSRSYDFEDFQEVDEDVYKVVITSLEDK